MQTKTLKVIAYLLFLSIMILGLLPISAISASSTLTEVVLDGQKVSFPEIHPRIEGGATLVPMRQLFERLGATLVWDNNTKTVTAKKGDSTILYRIGDHHALINSQNIDLPVAGQIEDGIMLVPLRFISESLGAVVGWNAVLNTATVSSSSFPKLTALVTKVIDGSMLTLTVGGQTMNVQLIGIDPLNLKGLEAYQQSLIAKLNKDLLNKKVYVEWDSAVQEGTGQTQQAYIYTETGKMENLELLSGGYSEKLNLKSKFDQSEMRWGNLLEAANQNAQDYRIGIWAIAKEKNIIRDLDKELSPTVSIDLNAISGTGEKNDPYLIDTTRPTINWKQESSVKIPFVGYGINVDDEQDNEVYTSDTRIQNTNDSVAFWTLDHELERGVKYQISMEVEQQNGNWSNVSNAVWVRISEDPDQKLTVETANQVLTHFFDAVIAEKYEQALYYTVDSSGALEESSNILPDATNFEAPSVEWKNYANATHWKLMQVRISNWQDSSATDKKATVEATYSINGKEETVTSEISLLNIQGKWKVDFFWGNSVITAISPEDRIQALFQAIKDLNAAELSDCLILYQDTPKDKAYIESNTNSFSREWLKSIAENQGRLTDYKILSHQNYKYNVEFTYNHNGEISSDSSKLYLLFVNGKWKVFIAG